MNKPLFIEVSVSEFVMLIVTSVDFAVPVYSLDFDCTFMQDSGGC
jgi:hypothetical protein